MASTDSSEPSIPDDDASRFEPWLICLVRRNNGNGAGGVGDDLLGDRPEDELGDPVKPGAADDNKCGVLGGVEQCF